MSWSERACEVLSRQGFPAAHFEDLWAGYGTGATCARCGQAIKSDHVEYELRFRQGVAITGIQVHRECWATWWQNHHHFQAPRQFGGFCGRSSVNMSMQAAIDDARRELESAYRAYELAIRHLDALPPFATHERAAGLIQLKVTAFNTLEAARMRYESLQKRAVRGV